MDLAEDNLELKALKFKIQTHLLCASIAILSQLAIISNARVQ